MLTILEARLEIDIYKFHLCSILELCHLAHLREQRRKQGELAATGAQGCLR